MSIASPAILSEERWDIPPLGLVANEYEEENYTEFDQRKSL
jgi:hypothetical protein